MVAAPKPRTKPTASAEARPILYPDLISRVLRGDTALTMAQAKELMGWEEEGDVKFGPDYLLTDYHKKKVRCTNNTRNRGFMMGWAETLLQKHLQRQWKLNGEPIIVGKCGEIISGQHRLLSFILAVQLWHLDPNRRKKWTTEPTMDTVIVYGVDESDDVVNTIDTGRPRSLADVLFRSSYFADKKPAERTRIARMAEYAIKTLWDRTGAKNDAFAPIRTHEESLDFIERHPRVLQAVNHIYIEDGTERKIGKYLSPGTAAGLLYLMGSSASDPVTYRLAETRSEKLLDWSLWDKAMDFFVLLASRSAELLPVCYAIGELADSSGVGGGGSRAEKVAILAKAWARYSKGQEIRESDLHLRYDTDEDGTKTLDEHPLFGGIDFGTEQSKDEEEEATRRNAAVPPPIEKAETPKPAPKPNATPDPRPTPKPRGSTVSTKEERESKVQRLLELRNVPKEPEPDTPKTFEDEIHAIRLEHPGKVLLFKTGSDYVAWGEDAHALGKVLKLPVRITSGLPRAELATTKLDEALKKLLAQGYSTALLEQVEGSAKESTPTSPQEPTPAASPEGEREPASKPRRGKKVTA